jgi:TolB-like protein
MNLDLQPAVSKTPAAVEPPRLKRNQWLIVAVVALLLALLGYGWWRRSGTGIRSIAVLPFTHAAGDPPLDSFAESLTESLMQNLSQVRSLRVMSRGAVSAYQGRTLDPRQAGQDLNVEALVIGRLQRQGERFVVQVEMLDVRDGGRLWGGRYERLARDWQTVQAEIAREIATTLQAHLHRSPAKP